MKVSYNILKELVDINISPYDLAERFDCLGFEVEDIYERGKNLSDKIIVGEVKKVERHPNADKLYVVKVDIGGKILNIVAGVKNYEILDKVPVALKGAVLPNGLKIEKKILRGIESYGMLCSEKELGISEDHSGIMILPRDVEVGKKLKDLKDFQDIIFDISITPNRSDCFSILGLAREIAALLNKKLKFHFKEVREVEESIKNKVKVKIENKNDCQAYLCKIIKNVQIKQSPSYIQFRLRSCGIRPINNVVDASNYAMILTGQPIHCFDLDKLEKPIEIIVRKSEEGERILTLDEQERVLPKDILLITNRNTPIAIAGIIGGKETEVSKDTKNILIESALFSSKIIRIGSRKIGLLTEASLRFERGLTFYHTKLGLQYVVSLIQKLAGGEVLKGEGGLKKEEKKIYIEFKKEEIDKILGINTEKDKIKEVLKNLEFEIEEKEDIFKVSPPIFRKDILLVEDIAEEIGRFLDYNTFERKKIIAEIKPPRENKILKFREEIRNILVNLGFSEVYNYSFYGEKFANFVSSAKDHLELANPLNEEQRYLRVSLFPLILSDISKNLINFENVKIFEIGKVYIKEFNKEGLPKEIEKLCFAFNFIDDEYEAYKKCKNVLENIFSFLDIDKVIYKEGDKVIKVVIGNEEIGEINILKELKLFKIKKGKVIYSEINLEKLLKYFEKRKKYNPIPFYPPLKFDISFIFKERVFCATILDEIKKISTLIESVSLIDEYISKDGRSLTFQIVFRAKDRTLKTEDIDLIIKEIVKVVEKKFKGKLKGHL